MKLQDVQFCCGCGKVKNELGGTDIPDQWMDLHRYRMMHGFEIKDLRFQDTYCPECADVQKRHDA